MPSPCHCAVLRHAARKLSATYDQVLAPLGLNIAQFALLRTIAYHKAMSLTALGQSQGLDRSTVGRNVRVLERMGLLASGRSDADQREVTVRLTDAGLHLLAAADPLWTQCQRALEARIGADRLATLRDILEAI